MMRIAPATSSMPATSRSPSSVTRRRSWMPASPSSSIATPASRAAAARRSSPAAVSARCTTCAAASPRGSRKTCRWPRADMNRVEIYTTAWCGYCRRAKNLLESKGVAYEEIRVDAEPARRAEMLERSEGRRTVPQIFIDGRGIGGCDDLFELERRGELDKLLGTE